MYNGVTYIIMKKRNRQILLKFNKTNTSDELDNMICTFEEKMNQLDRDYYLKESENPFIYFLEYPNPKELIKKVEKNEDLNKILKAIPVVCVMSNSNYVVSTILNKLRHKITYTDTFNITCHINSYINIDDKYELEHQIAQSIREITKIAQNNENPQWNINIYIIGDITGINIEHQKKKELYNNF